MESPEIGDKIQTITTDALIFMFKLLSVHQIITLCTIDESLKDFARNIISNRFPNIEKIINFKELNTPDTSRLITPQFIVNISKIFTKVISVTLSMDVASFKFCQTDFIDKLFLFDELQQIRIINIDTNNIMRHSQHRDLCIFNIRYLELKTVHNSFVIRLLDILELITQRKLPKLKEFKYTNNKLTPRSIQNIASKNLERISFKNILLTDNNSIESLLKESPNLKTIKMHYNKHNHLILTEPMQIQTLILNIKHVKKLEYLKIVIFKCIETLNLHNVIKMKTLKKLYILYESNVNLIFLLDTVNQTKHDIELHLSEIINWNCHTEGYTTDIQNKIKELKENPKLNIIQIQHSI